MGVSDITDSKYLTAVRSTAKSPGGTGPYNHIQVRHMKVCAPTLLLLAVSLFGLSLPIPAEDDPNTSYDESEQLPYEGAPLVFSEALRQTGAELQVPTKSQSLFQLGFPTRRDKVSPMRRDSSAGPLSESLTILDHSLRC
jgi:hypothetical protein